MCRIPVCEMEPPAYSTEAPQYTVPMHAKRLAMIAIGLQILYLIAANVFLNTSVGPYLVNVRPERFFLRWESGWSIVPGLVHASGIAVRVQTERLQWYLEADRTSLWVQWWKLPFRRLEASDIDAQGLSFLARRLLPDDSAPAATGAGRTPDIPGLSNPPYAPAGEKRAGAGEPWHIEFEDLEARDIGEIWVEQYRITGHGRAEAGRLSAVTGGGQSEMNSAELEFTDARLRVGDDGLATELQFKVTSDLEPVALRASSLAQAVGHISGSAWVQGTLKSLDVLNLAFRGLPIHIGNDDVLDMYAHLKLENGRLMPESRVVVDAERLTADYLHYTVEGSGVMRGVVSGDLEDPEATLKITFDRFALSDQWTGPYLRDRGFEIVITARGVGLAHAGRDLKVVATLPESFVPDLSHLNQYIPDALGLKIEKGTGRMESQFEFDRSDNSVAGEIKLSIADFLARYESVIATGHLDLHTVLNKSSLEQQHFDAEGTRLQLSDLSVEKDGEDLASGWWGTVVLGRTEIDLGRTMTVNGDASARMADTRPVLAVFEENEQLPDWIRNELTLEDVVADAEVDFANEMLEVQDFKINSDRLTVLGDLILSGAGRDGLLYIRHGNLGLAIERKDDRSHVRLVNAREWFNEKREEFRAAHR